MMGWLLVWHVLVAIAVLLGRRRLGRAGFLVGGSGPLAVLAWSATRWSNPGQETVETFSWVPSLDLDLVFRVDGYALVFLTVIGITGVLIFLFSSRYFAAGPRAADFAATMTLFGGAMVGLVISDHLLALFFFWELTTITSYLLIGFDDTKAAARTAALQAALVTGGGGLAMLAGLIILGESAGSYLVSDLLAEPAGGGPWTGLAWGLVLFGAVTKSAQFPFHGWLPGAMAAPTPASAFLHSATMVKAGIFLAGRIAPAALAAVAWWKPVVIGLGLITVVVGGWQALRQHDLKLLLAYGTVSQLGLLFLLIGSGEPSYLFGGLALLVAHGLFKAGLFLVVGTVDHEAGSRDLRRLSGLARSMPAPFLAAVGAGLSMAAIPLTLGFAAKEAAIDALLHVDPWLGAAVAIASILTVAYTGRFLIGGFGPADPDQDPVEPPTHPPSPVLTWPPLALAILGLALGIAPGVVEELVVAAIRGGADLGHLVIWPGFHAALAWSMVSLLGGALLVWRWSATERALQATRRVTGLLPSSDETFRRSLSGLITGADRSSSVIQNGSLPIYLVIILMTAMVLPAAAFLSTWDGGMSLPELGTPLEVLLGLLVVAGALGVATVGRRFGAVILLGAVGYGVAGLYAVWGGPDLSLTQILVETLAVALFALVLRHLPSRFTRARVARVPRMLAGVIVGVFVFAGGLVTTGGRISHPVSDFYLAEAIPSAEGSNVVNVILVDFRGVDTLGEITVLATAALGVIGLVAPLLRRWLQR